MLSLVILAAQVVYCIVVCVGVSIVTTTYYVYRLLLCNTIVVLLVILCHDYYYHYHYYYIPMYTLMKSFPCTSYLSSIIQAINDGHVHVNDIVTLMVSITIVTLLTTQ